MGVLEGGLEGERNALVLGAPSDPASVEACMELLAGDGPAGQSVLCVLFNRRPDRRLQDWERLVGPLPERFEVLSAQPPSGRLDGVDVEELSGPGNLTAVGVAITERLSRWPDDASGSLCLHSATALLQHASTDQVYQFLYTLRGHLAQEGVLGHVHLNPGGHDEQTVDTFKTLFDAVVEVDGDETTIRTR